MKTNTTFYTNMILLILGAFIFAFCLSSCEDFFETTIDIEAPEAVPKMVINTFIQPNQDTVGMYVGRNFPLSSRESIDYLAINADITIDKLSSNTSISVAMVENFQNNQRPNNYVNSDVMEDFFESGQEYLLTARDIDEEYPTTISQVRFPTKTTITNTIYDYEGGIREDGDEATSFTITFEDPAGEKNFYEVAIIPDYNPNDNQTRIDYTSTIDLAATKGFEEDYILLSDESFDGQEKTIELKIFRRSTDNFTYHLLWRDITEDYFKYSKTLKTQNDLGDNPFASIAPVYTNVENGLGIISLYQEQIIPLN